MTGHEAKAGARSHSERLLDDDRNRRLVDVARACGILLVILFHAFAVVVRNAEPAVRLRLAGETPWWLSIAWQALGSEMIFVTSGFLLSYLLIREHDRTGAIDVRGYIIRRIARIVPLYYVALVFYALVRSPEIEDVVWSALFLATIEGSLSVIPVGWSMEAMMQAYLLLPALVALAILTGRPLSFTLALVFLSVAVRFWAIARLPEIEFVALFPEAAQSGTFPKPVYPLYLMVWHRATPFLAGLFLAFLVSRHHRALGAAFARATVRAGAAALGAGLILWAGFHPVQDGASWIYDSFGEAYWRSFWAIQRPVFAAGLCLVSLALFYAPSGRSEVLEGILDVPIWRQFSRNIYAIYLFHLPCVIIAAVIVFRGTERQALGSATIAHVLAIWLLAAALSLALAVPLGRFVERPLRRRFVNRPIRGGGAR